MFEKITDKITSSFKKLRGHSVLTNENIDDVLKEIRLSLLEADVNYKVVKSLIDSIKEASIGQEVLKSVSPGEQFTKIFNDEYLKRPSADLVKNNVPNYAMVSEFVKGLRKLPVGNFVAFPAEIMRTGTNIVRRGLREINEEIILPDGTKVKPFQAIGYTRLFGMGATTIAVPAATAFFCASVNPGFSITRFMSSSSFFSLFF